MPWGSPAKHRESLQGQAVCVCIHGQVVGRGAVAMWTGWVYLSSLPFGVVKCCIRVPWHIP